MFEAVESTLFCAMCAAVIGVLAAHIASLYHPHIKRKVGPSYWGVYEGAASIDDQSMRVLELREMSKNADGLGGQQ